MEFHMINITYAALHMRAQTEKMTFSCKDDYCKALHIYWSGGARNLYIKEAHMVLDIFRFAVFFLPNSPSSSSAELRSAELVR